MQACEGALLVVDAAQGVEAQTVANVYPALGNDLEIIPVINKIDLPGADPEAVANKSSRCWASDARCRSGQRQAGHRHRRDLEAIVKQVPAPSGDPNAPLRALIFDSNLTTYRGVITYVRVVDGELRKGEKIRFMAERRRLRVRRARRDSRPKHASTTSGTGEVGYIVAAIKDMHDVRVGDTITDLRQPRRRGAARALRK